MEKLGILVHVSSLPGEYGIGDFGKVCYEFIDFLNSKKIKNWQILPLNKTNEFNCPYASLCYFSYDEMFFDMDSLVEKNLINKEDLNTLKDFAKCEKVDYKNVKTEKLKILKLAYEKISDKNIEEVKNFLKNNANFNNYAIFNVLLEKFNTNDWRNLPKEYLDKNSKQYITFVKENDREILYQGFIQYELISQWKKVRDYAKLNNVTIIGDLPIYPNPNSFDVLDRPDQFKVDKLTLSPLCYGGVPGDQFNPDGQNWGTCIYDWKKMKESNYEYMIKKINQCKLNYDILRLDHFIGFVKHYEYDLTGGPNKWVLEGGEDFFNELKKQCDMNSIVVEDLGLNLPEVCEVRDMFSLKGMCVVQMILEDEANKKYLPNNVPENSIYYLGTHDHNTFLGYLENLNESNKNKFCELMKINSHDDLTIHFESIKKMLKSKSSLVMIQIQDLLLEKSNKRMNVPGQAEGCWEYKMPTNYKELANQTLEKISNDL